MSLRAGFGVAPITPAVPVRLAGFGARTEAAQRVHDELEARALVLSDDTTTLCLLVLDLLSMSAGFATPIRDAVAHALGIDRDGVMTSCTHNHDGPNAMEGGDKLGWETPADYGMLLVERCVAAATAARDALEPAEASAVTAPLPDGISFNRRGLPYDPWFVVLDLRRPTGETIVTIVNAAIHPVSHGSPWLAVSTDWVGPFRAALTDHTGAPAILLSGALGDVNPVERHTDDDTHLAETLEEVDAIARTLADAVAATLPDAKPIDGSLRAHSTTITVPVGDTMLAQMFEQSERTIELVEWAIGDASIVAIPGEAFHALGRSITDARSGVTLLAGLACTWDGYLPMPFGDGYEESLSLGRDAVEQIGAALIAGGVR
jgi:neutral ceramidase